MSVCRGGPSDWHPFPAYSAGFIKVLFDPAFTWQFSSRADRQHGAAVSPFLKGALSVVQQPSTAWPTTVVSPETSTRGLPPETRGGGYADVLPYFKCSERKVGGGDDAYHGRAGEQAVTDMDWFHPVCEAFIAGAVGQGIPRNRDYNGVAQEGVGYYQRTILNGWLAERSAGFSFRSG